jgi:hypothetical protein
MKIIISLLLALFLIGCASYSGRGLQPGISSQVDIENAMGVPAIRWREADGGERLAYPRGPSGFHTYMVETDKNGVFKRQENVLEPKHFARLREDMTQDEVLRVIGPPQAHWTVYFAARDELVWEWRYCDDFAEPARFNVLFDNTTSGKLRTTMSRPESTALPFGRDRREWCSR